MSQILTIARKELRTFFHSPVALIFLATFLVLVLFSFFWVDTFFRRNIADVRPLFNWLPVLLIFLVSALTMRLWSEEQRMGTLEILLTLPVKTQRLVLGKFLAGLTLVALALALTLGLPFTVSMLGHLDWGPVIGGYLAALLLAAAYLSIGLCVSATTDNPIVALIVSAAICGGFYLVGSDTIVSFLGHRSSELLSALGTGSRFASIQRGVIDLRDLVYYASLCGGFLFLNHVILEAKRWSQGKTTQAKRQAVKLSAVLVLTNLLIFNVVIASVQTVRLDLTQNREYSISPVTRNLLRNLDAPLLIRGYFSAKTHPLLAPLVPRIRDIIDEYQAVGGDQVRAEFIDPQENPAAEKEANETYGIRSVPFQFADRHEAAVINSYFHLLVRYGDKHETLAFQDLIEVNVTGMRDIEVKLRNLEYDLTRTIKKVAYGFKPIEELFARVTDPITVTAYVSPQALPENLKEFPVHLEKVVNELTAQAGGKLVFSQVDPTAPDQDALRQTLYKTYGFRPMLTSLFGGDMFYAHLLLQAGDQSQPLFPSPGAGEGELRNEITAALRRLVPGFLKTVGLVTPPAETPPFDPRMGRQPPPQAEARFELLRGKLGENYTVKNVSLSEGHVPGDVDVLVVVGPKNLGEKERFAIDQFLMRGGAVMLCAGRYAMDIASFGGGGLSVKPVDSGLDDMLAAWGVEVLPQLVLDPQNEAFPIPVERNVLGLTMREIRMINYPFWVDIRPSGMASQSPIVSGLPAVTLQWVSPLRLSEKEGLSTTTLLRASDRAWTQEGADVQPNFARYPQAGFGHAEDAELKAHPLAVTVMGTFASSFKGQRSPLLSGGPDALAATAADGEVAAGNVIEQSVASSRLVVVGSSDFIRDEVLNLSRQTGSDRFTNNVRLAENLVDWSVADTDLLSIRARGTYARTLKPMDESERSRWEFFNYGLVVLALAGILFIRRTRRRSLRPIDLGKPSQTKR